MHAARFYKKEKNKTVRCFLCRHNCLIREGRRGICMARENKDGELFSIFYGHPCALAVDPIEKKPLFHFHPGTKSFSVATPGCNFQCGFCQNWDISQLNNSKIPDSIQSVSEISPQQVVDRAISSSCRTVSYTYTEPTVFYEYARDIATLAKQHGIENVFVTNGFMSRETLDDAKLWLAAANVDLKAFREETYKRAMKADLKGVLDSIVCMKKLGVWIEITTLVVPDMNDGQDELKDTAEFIAGVSKEIPWHISRFHPQYRMQNIPPTPHKTMRTAYEIGKSAGLKYVYMGNVPGDETENTYCWNCGEKLIERFGFQVEKNLLAGKNICPKCKSKIDGVF